MMGQWLAGRVSGEWVSVGGMPLLVGDAVHVGTLHVGDQLFRRVYVYDEDGILGNSTVAASIGRVGAVPTPVVPFKESTGVYFVTFPVFTTHGIYEWSFVSSGTISRVEKGRVRVLR